MGWEGQCGCEIEVIVKMKKKSRGRSGQGQGGGGGGQGGCERRIEVIVRMKKKVWGGDDISESIIGRSSRLLSAYQIFTKYSTHHSLSVNVGFKSSAVILFEILHLQNCHVNFKIFKGQ